MTRTYLLSDTSEKTNEQENISKFQMKDGDPIDK